MRTTQSLAIVLDASAAVELLLRTEAGRRARTVLRGTPIASPAHLDAEVLSALGRLSREGLLSESSVGVRLRALARAPINRYSLAPLLAASWDLRDNVALRDALYVCLARRIEATLVTADRSLSRAPGLEIAVTFVGP
jgi:predicted nucleic acid-binding protein